MAKARADGFSLHEIGLVSASQCRGLQGREPFLTHKNFTLHKCLLLGRPLAPKMDAPNLHVMHRKSELFKQQMFLGCCIKEKPHFLFWGYALKKVVSNEICLVWPLQRSWGLAVAWMDVAARAAQGFGVWAARRSWFRSPILNWRDPILNSYGFSRGPGNHTAEMSLDHSLSLVSSEELEKSGLQLTWCRFENVPWIKY